MAPNKTAIKKWINALRSGEYSQTKDSLQDENGYCCLGVACTLFIDRDKLDRFDGFIKGNLPSEQHESPSWLKEIDVIFREYTGVRLSDLNDSGIDLITSNRECMDHVDGLLPFTFDEIADLLQLVFIENALDGFNAREYKRSQIAELETVLEAA